MGIERQVNEKWTCDECGKVIENKTEAIAYQAMIRARGIHGLHRNTYVFCNKNCLNAWWKKATKENLIE